MASLWVTCAVPATAATSPPPVPPLPVGPSAFSPPTLTREPTPAERERAIANALKAVREHPQQAHVAADQTFAARNVVLDRDGSAHVRFDRKFKGLPVYGGDINVHMRPDGTSTSFDVANPMSPAVAETPTVDADRARAVARTQLNGTVLSVSAPRLAVRTLKTSAFLVWDVTVTGLRPDQTPSRLQVLVDAHTSKVAFANDRINTLAAVGRASAPASPTARRAGPPQAGRVARTPGTGRSVYSGTVPLDLTLAGGTYSMKDPSHGNGFTTDLGHSTLGISNGSIYSNTTGTFGNGTTGDPASTGVDAHFGAAQTYTYFQAAQGRNGIFGNGSGVPSRTHYGNGYANAFWDGTQMTYGDGVGNVRPLTELDVAGHEMSHGISGALIGWQDIGEVGGLNEGTSDIFGTMVEFYSGNPRDTPDYTIGELININGNNTPLRYMYNPSLDGASPNCYAANNGNLDPHHANGPLNHWFFLAAVGSGNRGYGNSPTCNGSTINGIGNDKASKIWYRVLSVYATSGIDYAAARTSSLRAAADLYGTHCTEYNTVNAAWAAVSVTGADPVPGTCGGQSGTPTITNPGNLTSTVGVPVVLPIKATDPGGKVLTYSATGLPAGLSINASTGVISGTPTAAGTPTTTITARNSSNLAATASFVWTIKPAAGACTQPGNKVTNGGFESGHAAWTATRGVVSLSGTGQTARTGNVFGWLDGYGTTHNDVLYQQVTIPAGCTSTLSFWLHTDTAETGNVVYDTLTVKIGSTTLATYSNLNAAGGYLLKSFNVSSLAGQTVTLSFTGREDAGLQTSFVVDDIALNSA
ncbi:M4 family metallopeptidase [Actinomadura scrupuli]|uniref:M4 family metallopeptidase n=1 Tax=Actinomadura scrupuli TaxID=559629 RepID=UPI003D95EC96